MKAEAPKPEPDSSAARLRGTLALPPTPLASEQAKRAEEIEAGINFIMGTGVPPALLDAQERAALQPKRRRVPDDGERAGRTFTRKTPYGSIHTMINEHPDDDEPFEMFVRIGKSGSEVNAWTEAIGRTISLLLSIPSPIAPRERLRLIASQLVDIGGGGSIGLGDAQIVSGPDAIAKIIQAYLGRAEEPIKLDETLPGKQRLSQPNAVRQDLCPSCGKATLEREVRCATCKACGWSKC